MTASILLMLGSALLGVLLGGVLNAAAIRWDKRLPFIYPPSYCTHGTHRLKPYAIIPLLHYAAKGGKCGSCGKPIEWRYAAGEAAVAGLFGLSACLLGDSLELIAAFFLICILALITQTDLTDKIVPNKVVAAGVIGAIAIRLFVHPLTLFNYAAAAFAGSGALLAIGLLGSLMLKKETMGGGDIKLYLFVGLMLGVKLTLLSLFLASVFGLIGGVALIASGLQSKGKTIPFGPYIAAGAITAYFWGNGIVNWYVGLITG